MLASIPASISAERRRRATARFGREPAAFAAASMLLLLILAALAAPLLCRWWGLDPAAVDLLARFEPPSAAHPLGTDELGRDLLARLLYGGRISLFVGVTGAVLAAAIGTCIGLAAGFTGGAVDSTLMRVTDAVLSLPLLPILIVVAAIDPAKLGLGLLPAEGLAVAKIVVIVALFGWPSTARLVRAQVLSLRRREFVTAARALGGNGLHIALRHVLPNAAGPIVVATTLAAGDVILAESVLSFLGLGIQPPTPSWGNMLTGAQELVWDTPMLAVWPGLLIFTAVVCFNLIGDGLSAALDPRHETR
ncbi:MAG: ABC transporter permease [Geminicoccaceae bacterium]